MRIGNWDYYVIFGRNGAVKVQYRHSTDPIGKLHTEEFGRVQRGTNGNFTWLHPSKKNGVTNAKRRRLTTPIIESFHRHHAPVMAIHDAKS